MAFPLVSSGIVNCLFFGVYGHACQLFGQLDYARTFKVHEPNYSIIYIAGCCGGIAQLSIMVPIDVVKVRLQVHSHGKWWIPWQCLSNNNPGLYYWILLVGVGSYKGPRDCVRRLWFDGGIRSCYKGLWIQAFRCSKVHSWHVKSLQTTTHLLISNYLIRRLETSLRSECIWLCMSGCYFTGQNLKMQNDVWSLQLLLEVVQVNSRL